MDQLQSLAASAEKQLCRPLTYHELTGFADWLTDYGFTEETVVAVIKEGQANGVTRFSYLEQIARQWFEEGVRTPDDAARLVARKRPTRKRRTAKPDQHEAAYRASLLPEVQAAVLAAEEALGYALPLSGLEAVEQWVREYQFSTERVAAVIVAGQQQGKTNVAYLKGIARNWHIAGTGPTESSSRQYREPDPRRRASLEEDFARLQLEHAELEKRVAKLERLFALYLAQPRTAGKPDIEPGKYDYVFKRFDPETEPET